MNVNKNFFLKIWLTSDVYAARWAAPSKDPFYLVSQMSNDLTLIACSKVKIKKLLCYYRYVWDWTWNQLCYFVYIFDLTDKNYK